MSKRIEITVAPNGEATVQTLGFTGPTCLDASRFIEETLGRRSAERLTSEFHQAAQTESQNQQQG